MNPPAAKTSFETLTGVDVPVHPRKRGALLPDPQQRPRHRAIISVDDHLVEPPDAFEGRLPARFAERAPRVVEDDDGNQSWALEGLRVSNIGFNAVVGVDRQDWGLEPVRFDQMRPGCYDVHARVRDMDLAAIDASLCFPSALSGFAGGAFARLRDQDFALALVRAWNDWYIESWTGAYPDRFIACQLPWLGDPRQAAEEVRRNADRGFTAVSFTELPVAQGLPSVHSGHWDPFLAACQETDTVVCLHGASSSWMPITTFAKDPPLGEIATLFPVNAILAVVDWVWSGAATRFPGLKFVMSESGISWVPWALERLDYVAKHSLVGTEGAWPHDDALPSEVVRRNFWFCSLQDPIGISLRHHIGVDRIMLEVDYPHSDSTWPDTQSFADELLRGIPDDEADLIASGNAAAVFRHPLPSARSRSEGRLAR